MGLGIVSAIHEDPAGVLWVGTAGGGLCRFDRESETFACNVHDPDDEHSLSSDTVWAIHQDQDGSLWLGTSAGLNRFSPQTGQIAHYTTADGLPHDSVVGILEDVPSSGDGQGDLWLSTLGGLSRFDPQSGTFRNYDAGDGLQGDIFNPAAFKTSEGMMLFGGQQGLTTFYPEDLQENPNIPPVHITGFSLSNEPVSIGGDSPLQQSILETERLELTHEEHVISFEFAALDYAFPEKNRYRYKLEGFDEEWIEAGSDRRFVTYTNLDPGEYTFKVLGSNNDGVWNEEGASISITITPPWWATWWFRGGMLLLLVGLVAGGFVWQRQSARRRERHLEATVAERTHELDERVKELDCLYGISRLAGQQGISLEQILGGVLDLLPPAMQYPEIACTRIVLGGQEFETDNFRATPWQQSSAIVVQGEQAGRVEVVYLEERPEADEGPFLEEERLLLNAIAERLGRIVERKQAEEALRVSEQKFRALFQGMPVPVYTWQRRGKDFALVEHNNAAEAITDGKIGDFLGTTVSAMYPDRPDIVQDISHAFAGRVSFQKEMAYSFKSTAEDKTLVVKYAFVPPDLVLVQTEDITERVQVEEALRESEIRLDLAVAGSNGGLWSMDLDPDDPGQTLPDEIYLSPRLKGFLGYEDEEFPNSMAAWESRVHREDLPRLRESSQKYRQGQIHPYELEYRIRHKDGSIRWLRTSGRVERDAAGRPVRFAGIDWDTTVRKEAEEALRYQATLLGSVSDAVITTDLDFVIQSWNSVAEALYGWPVEEAIGKPMGQVVPTEYPSDRREAVLAQFQAEGVWQGEVIQKHRDGSDLTVLASVSLVRDDAGHPISVCAVNRDITDRKQAEEVLRESEEKYRDLVEKISDVIYAIDTAGVVTFVSPAIESLLGFPPEQLIGQPFVQFVAPQDLGRAGENVERLLSGESPGPAEYQVLTASGETRWMRASSQPIEAGGRVTGLQGVLTDITERKRVEEQLEQAAASAERQRLARELHDSVTQTLYSLDLFANAAQEALSKGKIETGAEHTQRIRALSQSALADMRLLVFELQPPLLEQEGLAGALRARLERVEARAGLKTEFGAVAERPLSPSVEAELYAVAQEALNNALKHAQAEQITVKLEYEEQRCCLSIQDDGVGFDLASAERGGGFGLRNMRDRVERVGGNLTLETAPGRGTTVRVEVTA